MKEFLLRNAPKECLSHGVSDWSASVLSASVFIASSLFFIALSVSNASVSRVSVETGDGLMGGGTLRVCRDA